MTSVSLPSDVIYNKPFKSLIRTKYNESISTKLINSKLSIGDKYNVSRGDLIPFICHIIDELNHKYHPSKKIFKSFEQCGLNYLCKNTDLLMKHLESLTETSMYKALTDQREALNLSNEQNIFSNNLSSCESDESNV